MNEDDKSRFYGSLLKGLGFAAILGAFFYTAVDANASQIKTEIIEPVVKINDSCSAVHVDIPQTGDFYLTAKHCVVGDKEGYFTTERRDGAKLLEEKKNYFEVERQSGSRDLALLKMREPTNLPKATIAENIKVDEGDEVWAVGYPLAWTRTITEGLYNGTQVLGEDIGSKEDIEFIRSSPPIAGGNSGGGLFQKNPDNGKFELIGVTSMGARSATHVSLWVPLKDIREFLNLKVDKPTLAKGLDGVAPPALKTPETSTDLR